MPSNLAAELFPCPFCGGPGRLRREEQYAYVYCQHCEARGQSFDYTDEEYESGVGDETDTRAIVNWNGRTHGPAIRAMGWRPIAEAPIGQYVVARNGRQFLSTPYIYWRSKERRFGPANAIHEPTHFLEIPEFPSPPGDANGR